MTASELKETYSKLTSKELLEIIDHKFDYTELAVSVAIAELANRAVTEAEIAAYKEDQIEKAHDYIQKNITFDLTFFQKTFFFFIWFPLLTFPFRQNFRDTGYELKLRQANYYSLLGALSCIGASSLCAAIPLSNYSMFALWVLCFLASYGFDESINRRMLIDKLRALYASE